MTFWILAGALAICTTAVLAAAARGRDAPVAGSREASLAIYRDQLAEIDRDLRQGLLEPAEAEGQKAEIGRRLLAAARVRAEASGTQGGGRWVMLAVLAVPAIAFLTYNHVGAPGVPDVPRAARMAAAQKTGDIEALLAQVEDHLEAQPDDATGWKLLVPNYMAMGRYADAANAIGRVIELDGGTAELYADQAEALVLANNGLTSAAVDTAVAKSLEKDANYPKALYFEALSRLQGGHKDEAKQKFATLLAMAPADAPWRSAVEGQLKALSETAKVPALSGEQMDQAANMSGEDRQAMIRGMVDGLEQRLNTDSKDVEGWLRLIRARSVLQELDKAKLALTKAKEIFAGDASAVAALDTLAKELNLQ